MRPPKGFEKPAPLVLPMPEDTSGVNVAFDKLDEKPTPISQKPPYYNYRQYEGTVMVKFLVDRAGDVIYACVVESSGHTGLDNDALRAVIKWKFSPAVYKGEPVQCWITAPIRFRLE